MGLFFNYDKPGKGVDKYAPKKKGIFLYFELFFRKFWLLLRANLLYFAVSIPVILLYNFIITNAVNAFFGQALGDWTTEFSIILTAILVIFWGTGPASCGYTFLLRNFALEEHVFLESDFFGKIKENLKLGIVMLVIDILVLVLGINAANIYMALMSEGVGVAKYAMGILVFVYIVYTFFHYYIYELGVTFENTLLGTLKNALILAAATLPANIFLSAFVVIVSFALLSYLTPFAVIFAMLVFWISFMRFPIDFYAARMIKRRFIDTQGNEESGK